MQNLSNKYELVKNDVKGEVEIKDLETKEIIHKKIRKKVPGGYCSNLIEPINEVLLGEIQGDSTKAKLKKILLYEPDDIIELKDSGILSFEYKFKWENEKFVCKKRVFSKELECKMVQAGDEPDIGIALYQPKKKTLGTVEIMSDNMSRLNIQDRRGLEYVLLISILSFLDKSDDDQLAEKEKAEKLLQEKRDEEYARKLLEDQRLKPPSDTTGYYYGPRSNSLTSASPRVYPPPSSESSRATYYDDNTFQTRKQKLAKHKPKEYTNEYGW
ncbi:11397_t:CDS:2 [Scutellospora calospora]|uniref:11397_t:CDS:1 n=1 Tax=Scutellospora calospora TaxID=85575 RepID=A0ACA9LZF4_9GLOM|nr:11397_t:CDS:2 [Scutellospora calospora]